MILALTLAVSCRSKISHTENGCSVFFNSTASLFLKSSDSYLSFYFFHRYYYWYKASGYQHLGYGADFTIVPYYTLYGTGNLIIHPLQAHWSIPVTCYNGRRLVLRLGSRVGRGIYFFYRESSTADCGCLAACSRAVQSFLDVLFFSEMTSTWVDISYDPVS